MLAGKQPGGQAGLDGGNVFEQGTAVGQAGQRVVGGLVPDQRRRTFPLHDPTQDDPDLFQGGDALRVRRAGAGRQVQGKNPSGVGTGQDRHRDGGPDVAGHQGALDVATGQAGAIVCHAGSLVVRKMCGGRPRPGRGQIRQGTGLASGMTMVRDVPAGGGCVPGPGAPRRPAQERANCGDHGRRGLVQGFGLVRGTGGLGHQLDQRLGVPAGGDVPQDDGVPGRARLFPPGQGQLDQQLLAVGPYGGNLDGASDLDGVRAAGQLGDPNLRCRRKSGSAAHG